MHWPRVWFGRRQRAGVFSLIILLLISSLAGCANSQTTSNTQESFSAQTRIVVFVPGSRQWVVTTFGMTRPGSEFYFSKKLFRVVGSGKAQVFLPVDSAKLFEADRPSDASSRQPKAGDVVQILGADTRPVSHVLYDQVKPGNSIRFQGVAYSVSSQGLAKTSSSATSTLQRIEITASAWQHVIDRHIPGGSMTAGKSVFNSGVDVRSLIVDAQLLAPVPQSRGNCERVCDAGRGIGVDRTTGRQTSTYTVITRQSGKLVTAFPGLP